MNESISLKGMFSLNRQESSPPSSSPLWRENIPFADLYCTLEAFSKAALSLPNPFPSSPARGMRTALLTAHLIFRSFKADSKLFTSQMLMPPSMPVVQNCEHLALPPLSTEI